MKRPPCAVLLAGLAWIFAAGNLSAGDPPPVTEEERTSWLDQGHLLNDWFGYGPAMRDHGISITGSFTTDLLGNPIGGFSQGFAGATSMGMQMVVDLEKLVGIPHLSFITSGIWRTGENLSADRIGNLFTVAQLFGGSNLRLYEFMLRTELFEDRLMIQAGRMGAFDQFLTSPINWNFVNNGFDGTPKGIFFNAPAFGATVYPTSSWGLISRWREPETGWYVQAGGFLLDSQNGSNSTNGMNWTFNVDQGWAVIAEAGWRLNEKPGTQGLPGYYAVGGFYTSDEQATFSLVPRQRSNAGAYLMAQQTIYRSNTPENLERARNVWGPGAMDGFTLFSVWVFGPDESINQFPLYNNSGFVWQGVFPGRPDDFLAGGIASGFISRDLKQLQRLQGNPVQDYEIVLELNYRYQITPFVYVQPDMQYVIRPGATGNIPDALVLGAQMSVIF